MFPGYCRKAYLTLNPLTDYNNKRCTTNMINEFHCQGGIAARLISQSISRL
jgi:hypothetical protein